MFLNLCNASLKGDYESLTNTMGFLMRVKERRDATDRMFEPLKETIELLQKYGQELPESTHEQLQVQL